MEFQHFFSCLLPLPIMLPILFFIASFTVVSRIYLSFFFSCCRRYYIVLSLAPIGLLPVRLSSWLACVWGCRNVKGLCQYTSSAIRSWILALIPTPTFRDLPPCIPLLLVSSPVFHSHFTACLTYSCQLTFLLLIYISTSRVSLPSHGAHCSWALDYLRSFFPTYWLSWSGLFY